jgi:hypothetical protein
VELLKLAFPGSARLSVLTNPKNPGAPLSLDVTKETAGKLGLRVTPVVAGSPDDLRALTPANLSGTEALAVLPDAMFWG